jgi:hypothetical protein
MNDIIAKAISKKALFDCIQTFYQSEEDPSAQGGAGGPPAKPRGFPLMLDPLPDPNFASRRDSSALRDSVTVLKQASPPNSAKTPRNSEA